MTVNNFYEITKKNLSTRGRNLNESGSEESASNNIQPKPTVCRRNLMRRPCADGAFVVMLVIICQSTASTHFANNLESCTKSRSARSAPPELRRRNRGSSYSDSNYVLSRPASSSFSLERSASDDSMRATVPSCTTSEPPPICPRCR